MDEFRKYLRDNKSRMDYDIPGSDVWENIKRSNQKKIFPLIKLIAAASLIIMLFLGGYFFMISEKNTQIAKTENKVINPENFSKNSDQKESEIGDRNSIVISKENPIALKSSKSRINYSSLKKRVGKTKSEPEITVAESFDQMQKSFAIIINMQLNKVKSTPLYGEDASYFSVFKKEFQDLNIEEKGAKQEIVQNGLNDVQIEKLINIYQQKILLLKRLQSEISKMNVHAPNVKDNNQKQTYINL